MTLLSNYYKTMHLTENLVQSYAELSKDRNPIHLSTESAQQQAFPERVVHGMLLLALHNNLCTPLYERQWIVKKAKTKFIHPAYVNDTIHFSLDIVKIMPQKLTTTILCTNHNNKTIFYGKIEFVRSDNT